MFSFRKFVLFSIVLVLGLMFVGNLNWNGSSPNKLYGMFWQQPYSMPTQVDVPFYINYGRFDNLTNKPLYISGLGATRTLSAFETGATIDLDRAAGIVVTLPAPAEGLWYNFLVSVSVTSNNYKFSTGTQNTDFITGGEISDDTDSGNVLVAFDCDGSTHDNFTMNGTTTGGLIGSRFKISAVSTTVWLIEGVNRGSGTVATSCATS